jgi:uncharacterized membrane protein YkoI
LATRFDWRGLEFQPLKLYLDGGQVKQRTAILLAMGLTAFVVILVGAVAFALTTKSVVPDSAETEVLDQDSVGGEVGNPLNDAEVNQVQPTAVPATQQPVLLSTNRATQIAMQIMPGSSLQKAPELVNFQGKMAYEVLLSGGTVYVDAFTGRVLSSVASVISNPPPDNSVPSSGGGDGGGGNEVASNNAPAPQEPAVQNDNANDNFDDNFNDNGDDDDDDSDHSGHGRGGDDDDDEDHSGHGRGGDDDDNHSGKGGGGDDDDD